MVTDFQTAYKRIKMVERKVCLRVTIALLFFGSALRPVKSASSDVHLKLLGDLMDNYTKPFMRPVNETTKTVDVGLQFTPIFSTLDETKEELKVRGMLDVTWKDYRLQWQPTDYDDINETNIPLSSNDEQQVWVPELTLYECLVTDFHSFYPETTGVTLIHTGQIIWHTLATTQTYCMMDNTKFPFDVQTCNLTFTTWLYQENEQIFYIIDDLVVNDTYKKYELRNALWSVKIQNIEANMITYDCETCNGKKHSYVRYTLELTRGQSHLLILIFIYPCSVISVLLIPVPLLPHKVDVDAPGYALTCVMTLFVCLTFLYTRLPATGAAAIGAYITFVIGGGIFAVIVAVFINPDSDTTAKEIAPAQEEQGDGMEENDPNIDSDRIPLRPVANRDNPNYSTAQNSGGYRRVNRSARHNRLRYRNCFFLYFIIFFAIVNSFFIIWVHSW